MLRITDPARRLFILGFITLFAELMFIRFLSAYVWNLGYFPNFVLIFVFVGIGIGFIFHRYLGPKQSELAFAFVPIIIFVFALLTIIFKPLVPGFTQDSGLGTLNTGGEIFLFPLPRNKLGSWLGIGVFPILAVFVITIFALLAQQTAKVFSQLKPLQAYSWDIAGSCVGIVAFMLFGFLKIPAQWWFWILFIVVLPLFDLRNRIQMVAFIVSGVCATFVHIALLFSTSIYEDSKWSPYQQVTIAKFVDNSNISSYQVSVNGIAHQNIYFGSDILTNVNAYPRAYETRRFLGMPPIRSAMIIGSGTGNDVQVALLNDVEEIDAVEIDPVIAEFGQRFNPFKPYSDPRVNLIIDDGRSALRKAERKYDMIVFALTDSLVKVSAVSQLRLENYLFTEEAFTRAYELLNDGGFLVSYNHYSAWLPDKFAGLFQAATGQNPIVEKRGNFYILIATKNVETGELFPRLEPATDGSYDLPTDDWPFLHVRKKSIPEFYLRSVLIPGALIFILLFALGWRRRKNTNPGFATEPRLRLAFFLMGASFLLLQTKSVIQYSLLFGNTWINNSLVFLASLLLILLANYLASRQWLARRYLPIVIGLLFASCVLGALLPLRHFLYFENELLRFVLASLFTFSPLFFANLIFSMVFRHRDDAEIYFGWNLLGAVAGGLLEYLSIRFGYASLSWAVLICYLFASICLSPEWRVSRKLNVTQKALSG